MIFKFSACSEQYQNISLYIKGQKILIIHKWMDVCYPADIQSHIGCVDFLFTGNYTNAI